MISENIYGQSSKKVPFSKGQPPQYDWEVWLYGKEICMYRLYFEINITCLSTCKKEVGDGSKKKLCTFSNHKRLRQKIGDVYLKQTKVIGQI